MNKPSFLSIEASTILSELAKAYGFDLFNQDQDIYLRLELNSYMPLVLERHTPYVISLSHYVEQNGDLMSDPDVSFLVRRPSNSKHLLIFPIAITQSFIGSYREVAYLNHDNSSIKSFYHNSMADLTNFCNQWMSNIFAQGWFLEDAKPNPFVTVTTF
jgi:hypothetical protein